MRLVPAAMLMFAACSSSGDGSARDSGVRRDSGGAGDAGDPKDAAGLDSGDDVAADGGRDGGGRSRDWIWGVTVDDVGGLDEVVDALSGLSRVPTVRVVFDEWVPAGDYAEALSALHSVGGVMGEILDSSAVEQYSVEEYRLRAEEYVEALAGSVDLWEVGNEINGEWLGETDDVVSKMTAAFDLVEGAGAASVLTLYYNEDCWEDRDHEMFAWAEANVPARMREGLEVVLVSYYEDDCNGLQPDWPAVFGRLAGLFPAARLGIGECGTVRADRKAEYVTRYYGMRLDEHGFVGGFFWWYFREDMVPRTRKLWSVLDRALAAGP